MCIESAVDCLKIRVLNHFRPPDIEISEGLKRGFHPYARNARNPRNARFNYASNARSKTPLARKIERSNLTQAISRDKFQPCHWPLLAYAFLA